jgi:tetratricopeptide (TPR) repeat protein
MGDKAAALASHRQALIATQTLIQALPSDPLACHDLATAYNNVGDLLAKTGHLREGLDTYRRGLAVCEWVDADDPNSTQANTRGWLDDYLKIGEMLTQLGNKKEAYESYQKAMRIAQRLSSADPQNAQAASDLSDYYQSFGDSQMAFGERFAALGSYRHAVAIRERLSARDLQNAEARANLAFSYATLGRAYETLASGTGAPVANQAVRWREARGWYQKSSHIWTEKRARGSLTRSERETAEKASQGIARCDAALGNRQMHTQDYLHGKNGRSGATER